MINERTRPFITAALALVGLSVAGYLVSKQLASASIGPCPLFGDGCSTVLKSSYSKFLGIPLSVYGVIFYSIILVLSGLLIKTKKEIFGKLLAISGLIGFLDSVMFIYIQGALIGSYCFYCVLSAMTATLIFFVTLNPLLDLIFDFFEKRK